MTARPAILVIKLGALGDIVQATGAFTAIRARHPDAHLILMTTKPFADFVAAGGWFDEIWPDGRPRTLAGWRAVWRHLRGARFDWVYDLQTSDRTAHYFRLLRRPKPNWNGIAAGCSHPHRDPARDTLHTLQRLAGQLAVAGIADIPAPNLDWAVADISALALPVRYVVLAVGGSADRLDKRWPADHFVGLADRIVGAGATPVLVGTAADATAAGAVRAGCPTAVDLIGRTGLLELATVARGAVAAVGNDTGPMHIAAAAGTPSCVLFSGASDPALCAPVGDQVTTLRRDPMTDLTVDEVAAKLRLG